jgi:3-oxoacyl-[acyl-carrier-protein] synthase II
MERYVVTGLGAYNGLGSSAEQSWTNLLAGKSAVTRLSWPEDDLTRFPVSHSIIKTPIAALSNDLTADDPHPEHFDYGWKHWDKNTRACLLAVDEAWQDSRLTSTNVGVVVSTFGSGTSMRLEVFSAMNNGVKKVSPRKALNIGLDFPAAQISNIYKITGPNTAMDSACITGLTSINHAINTLKEDCNLDAMIVGGSDHMADPIYLYWFQSLGALSQEDSLEASRPWDKNRNGFVMGEGAATIIIEPLSKALARGAKIYGEILSTSFVTIFDSDTSPDPTGKGARTCVEQALRRAGITADQVDYINAHATSTPIGDQIEFDVMLDIFPGRTMVSNKGAIGHGMAASGIIETVYSLLVLRDQRTPGNLNLKDPLGQGMILPTVAEDISVKYIIKNSFGFGGRNASIVLERYDG